MKGTLFEIGRYFGFIKNLFYKPEKLSIYVRQVFREMVNLGIGSLWLVALTSAFMGAVITIQSAYNLVNPMVPLWAVGIVARDSIIIEFSPTIIMLVLAGKVGSSLASEIGGMRQKEHIDAMEIMGVNTAAFLVQPKILAALTIIPMLVCIGAFISICGGYIASVPFGRFSHEEYEQGLRSFFIPYNITMMFVKALTFSFILTTVSCYQGYFVKGGSIELGHASTQAVVYSNILILLSDYVIAMLMTA